MLNMIRMELYRMFKTKSLYVIWLVLAAGILFTTGLSADEMKTYTMEEKQEMYEYATGQQKSDTVNLGMDVISAVEYNTAKITIKSARNFPLIFP